MLISVIIPVYNIEKYLGECLDSVIKQRYIPDEVILIDDGSTDYSGKICDKYVNEYSYFKVIHRKNKGVSSARNLGIKMAKGDYLLFIDGDDILSPYYIEKLVRGIQQSDSDLAICGFSEKKTDVICKDINIAQSYVSIADDMIIELIAGNRCDGYLWNKIWKKCIIDKNNIKFDEDLKIFEDLKFCYDYFTYCGNIFVLELVLYYYRQRDNSAVRVFDENKRLQQYRAIDYIYNNENKKQRSKIVKYLKQQKMNFAWLYLQQVVKNRSVAIKEVKSYIKKEYIFTGIITNTMQLMRLLYIYIKK